MGRGDDTRRSEGKIVLVGRHTVVPVNFNKPPLRRDDESLRRQYQPDAAPAAAGRAEAGTQGRGTAAAAPDPGQLSATAVAEQVDAMLVAAGVLVRINDAGREHGQIRAFNNRTFDLGEGRADGRDAQRGLRPHRAHPRRRHAGRARIQHRQPDLSRRPHVVQRGRRDPRHRQEGRSRDARRPPRLVALARPAPPTTRSAAR